jgi:hypothetical protein
MLLLKPFPLTFPPSVLPTNQIVSASPGESITVSQVRFGGNGKVVGNLACICPGESTWPTNGRNNDVILVPSSTLMGDDPTGPNSVSTVLVDDDAVVSWTASTYPTSSFVCTIARATETEDGDEDCSSAKKDAPETSMTASGCKSFEIPWANSMNTTRAPTVSLVCTLDETSVRPTLFTTGTVRYAKKSLLNIEKKVILL